MLGRDLGKEAVKGSFSAQPFVDHDTQRILVAGRTWMGLDLFGSHIGNRACSILRPSIARTLSHHSNTKVTEQHLVAASQQHILRLDVAMYQLLIVGILQRLGNLLHIIHNRGK